MQGYCEKKYLYYQEYMLNTLYPIIIEYLVGSVADEVSRLSLADGNGKEKELNVIRILYCRLKL